jgi:hypothetical protein
MAPSLDKCGELIMLLFGADAQLLIAAMEMRRARPFGRVRTRYG